MIVRIYFFSSFYRAQVMLSAGLSTFTHIIKLFAIPQTVKENLCAALVNSVIDCTMQSWEEMTAPAFDVLNRIGPLRKNKNSAMDDTDTIDFSSFEFERFKRHLHVVLERVCRLAASENQAGSLDTDESLEHVFSTDDALKEEDDDAAIAEIEDTELPTNKTEEESDWICDVKSTMNLLPRL